MAPHEASPRHHAGAGSPLVLVHGLGMSWRAWRPLFPALERTHEILAPTLVGHRGGPPVRGRMTIASLADALESELDAAGMKRPHVVGNSLGGWLALELARRGRARSVTAVSPAGAWRHGADLLRLQVTIGTSSRLMATAPVNLAMHSAVQHPHVRRVVLRRLMERADRMTTRAAQEVLEDVRGCVGMADALAISRRDGQMPEIAKLDAPVQLVWGRKDRVIPYSRYGRPLRDRIPGVTQVSLPGAGHVPMYDVPRLLEALILNHAAQAQGAVVQDAS